MLGLCLALRHRYLLTHLEVVGHEGGEESVDLLLPHQCFLGPRTEAARPALVVDAALGAGEARAAALVDGLVPSQGEGEGEGEGEGQWSVGRVRVSGQGQGQG